MTQGRIETRFDGRGSRLRTLAELNQMVSSSLDVDEVLGAIARAAATLMDAPFVEFWVGNESTQTLELRAYSDPELGAAKKLRILPFGEGGAGWVAIHRRLLEIPDVFTDGRLRRLEWWRDHDLRSAVWVPILLDGSLLGVLSVCGRAPFRLRPDDRDLLESFVAQAVVAIRHARLFAESEARRRAAEAYANLGHILSQATEPAEVAQRIAECVCPLLDVQCSALFRLEPDSGDLVRIAVAGDAVPLGEHVVFPRDTGVVALAVRDREAVVTLDLLTDPRVTLTPEMRQRIEEAGYRAVLAVPLLAHDRVLGALALGDRAGRPFDSQEVQLAQTFADQAAIAIEKARLYRESERQRRRLATLVEVSQRLTRGLELPVVLGAIADAAAQLFAGEAGFRLVDGNELVRIGATPGALRAMIRERMPIGASISGRVAQTGEPIVTADNAADPRGIPEDRPILKRNLMRAQMCVPIRLGVRILGVLQVYREVGYHFDEQAVQLAMTFADQAAVAIENARLYQESESRRKRLATLVEVSQRLTRGLDLPAVLGSIAGAAAQLFEGEAGFRIVEGDDLVRVGATPGALPAMVRERLRMGESITGQVALTGEPIVSEDSAADLRMSADHRAARLEYPQLGSLMCVPIRLGTQVLGTLNIYRERGHHFDEDNRQMAMTFADQAAIAIENARLYGHAQAQATALEAKNAELDSFVYMVSHDLKAPLVTLQGMTSMLALDCAPALDERGRHYLTRIDANIAQMEQLISDLLALSRVGREARPSEAVCLGDVVDEVLAGLAECIRVRGVKVERGDLGTVWGIRTQLTQVFTNLIGNAVKYLGDVAEPRIAIGTSDQGSWIECSVTDNGIGIDPAYHTTVFELFQRLKEVPVEGSGVGLPIVKKIVEAAGGRIWVESAKGHGATFFFTWPKTAGSR